VPASDDAAGTTPIGSTGEQPQAMTVWLGTAPSVSMERQVALAGDGGAAWHSP
jgi:hypothetical protein